MSLTKNSGTAKDTSYNSRSTRSFDGWQDYPFSLPNYDLFGRDAHVLNTSISSRVFCEASDTSRIDLFEVSDVDSEQASHFEFSNEATLENHLAEVKRPPKFTVMSISQTHSLMPLRITEKTMRKILTYYQVNPEFLATLSNFGDHPQAADAGSGDFITCISPSGSYEMMYTLKYAEENGRSRGNKYSIRQTAIYHQYSTDDTHLWIILHPKNNTAFYTSLRNALLVNRGVSQLKKNPLGFHALLFSSYAPNWKQYLSHLSQDFLDSANIALTIDPKDSADYRVSFETLQSLRNVHDKLFLVSGYLKTSVGIVKRLEIENRNSHSFGGTKASIDQTAFQLNSALDLLQGGLNSAEILQERIQGILNLLSDVLNLKKHDAAIGLNEYMLVLTRESVDDSSTVRVVGAVSLVYLPATFIATLLGTDVFIFQPSSSKLEIAQNFWAFWVFTIPLTILTLGCWVILTIRKKNQRTAQRARALE